MINSNCTFLKAGSYSKYVGFLRLKFDSNGDLYKPVNGEGVAYAKPYILDKSIPKDEGVLKVMAPFEQKLERFKKVVGSTKVFLTRDGRRECLVGNFVADAFRKVNKQLTFILKM